MVIIVHSAPAWEQVREQYEIGPTPEFGGVETPKSFPVLVTMQLNEDGVAMDGAAVINVGQAAKLLSVCTDEQLSVIAPTVFQTLTDRLSKHGNKYTKATSVTQPVPIMAQDSEGQSVTLTGLAMSSDIKVGDVVTVNNEPFTVIQTGTSTTTPPQFPAGVEDITLDMSNDTIPGIVSIPLDPGKLDDSQKIADLNDNGHVLDVERSV